jgi:type IV secretion system protein VirB10
MFLKPKQVTPPDTERSTLQEVAAIGATPGQRLIGLTVSIVGAGLILGAIGYKYVLPNLKGGDKAEKKSAAANAADTAAPTAPPKLNVPLDLNSASAAPAPTGEPFPQSGGDKPFPPGLIGSNVGGQAAPATGTQTAGQANPPQAEDTELKAAQARKLGGGFESIGKSESIASDNPQVKPVTPANGNAPASTGALGLPGGPQAAGTALQAMLVGTSTPGTSASYISNQHLMLAKNTSISCVLDGAIQTDQPGFVSCLTDYPVRSMDGKVVLMERGTKIEGEYQKGVERGMNAIFVLWTTARTPMGVVVNLASPGTDALGRAGIHGEVDNKFWERFGGAFMFSFFQDGTAALLNPQSSSSSGGGNVVIMPNTQGTTQTAVGEILKQGSDIKSSLYKNQGETVAITVARNIDFSTVYKLVMAQ